ncbi:MAG: hypothetical protein JW891_14470 [Candidatus Lokiarchaeota archaeon]|nr:hypothetical protein [Candidatus Lokiarchaeota archaeon]
MSMIPFSANEIRNLREIFEKNGWRIGGGVEDLFRYGIKNNNLVLFTLKMPLTLTNIQLNVPYEVVSFKISVAFKLWHLNDKTYRIIAYMMKALEELSKQVSLKPEFSMEGKLQSFLKILNVILPDRIKSENERSWLNRLRISIMNKREHFIEDFKDFDTNKVNDIVKILLESGLSPTFKIPWELKMGVPKLRTSETLLFANEVEVQDEFFVLEKGYMTYFKDIIYNKIFIRSFFECYNPYILHSVLERNDSSKYQFELSVKNWIKLSRLLLNTIIEIINEGLLDHNDFMDFRPENEFIDKEFEEETSNFALSALNYESSISKELFDFHIDLLDSPPTHFEVIETSLFYYTKAEANIREYKFDPAIKLLNESLKVFNKYRQGKAVVSVLLLLRKIASRLNQVDVEQNYLESALNLAEKGTISKEVILDIRYKLAKAYFRTNQLEKARSQFFLVSKLLSSNEILIEHEKKDYFIGMVNLYLGLVFLKQERIADSKKHLKQAFLISNTILKVKLNFCLFRAIEFKKGGKAAQALKLLTSGLNALDEKTESENRHQIVAILIELAEIYIYDRKSRTKAAAYLEEIEKRITLTTIKEIQFSARWNILMSDYYRLLLNNKENTVYYSKQAENLKDRLKEIGVKENNKDK